MATVIFGRGSIDQQRHDHTDLGLDINLLIANDMVKVNIFPFSRTIIDKAPTDLPNEMGMISAGTLSQKSLT